MATMVIENANMSKTAAELTTKVAAMTPDERVARIEELAHTDPTAETTREFAKLVFGSDAEVI